MRSLLKLLNHTGLTVTSDELIDLLKTIHTKVPIVEVSIRREANRFGACAPQVAVYLQGGGTFYQYVDDEGAEKVRQYAQEISGQ